METEIWTTADIAKWLRLSPRHVGERFGHEPGFQAPLNTGGAKRWLRSAVEEFVISRPNPRLKARNTQHSTGECHDAR